MQKKHLNKKITWIAWEDDASIRSKVLAEEIKAKFHAFTSFESSRYLSILRYPVAKIQTFITLLKEKPNILFVQNPSIVLAFFAAILKPLFKYKLVIDLHTLYIDPKGIKKIIMDNLNRYSLSNCDIVIVTNKSYRSQISKKNKKLTEDKIFVLPDKIPEIKSNIKKTTLKGKDNIFYICTFSEDEPWKEVIRSAETLDKDTFIYISGKNRLNKDKLPKNIILTGFLPTEEYQSMLISSDIIMVLTSQENCLVCGGYEAVAAEKPLILSDKKTLKEYFKGAVFTENNSKDISKKIKQTIKDKKRSKKEIEKIKKERNSQWKKQWNILLDRLDFKR